MSSVREEATDPFQYVYTDSNVVKRLTVGVGLYQMLWKGVAVPREKIWLYQ